MSRNASKICPVCDSTGVLLQEQCPLCDGDADFFCSETEEDFEGPQPRAVCISNFHENQMAKSGDRIREFAGLQRGFLLMRSRTKSKVSEDSVGKVEHMEHMGHMEHVEHMEHGYAAVHNKTEVQEEPNVCPG